MSNNTVMTWTKQEATHHEPRLCANTWCGQPAEGAGFCAACERGTALAFKGDLGTLDAVCFKPASWFRDCMGHVEGCGGITLAEAYLLKVAVVAEFHALTALNRIPFSELDQMTRAAATPMTDAIGHANRRAELIDSLPRIHTGIAKQRRLSLPGIFICLVIALAAISLARL